METPLTVDPTPTLTNESRFAAPGYLSGDDASNVLQCRPADLSASARFNLGPKAVIHRIKCTLFIGQRQFKYPEESCGTDAHL